MCVRRGGVQVCEEGRGAGVCGVLNYLPSQVSSENQQMHMKQVNASLVPRLSRRLDEKTEKEGESLVLIRK